MAVVAADLAFTRADLDALPNDGRRHELLDGAIVVNPSPGFAHQRVLMGLIEQLQLTLPEDLVLLAGPFDVVLPQQSVVVPDLIVAPHTQFAERDLRAAPLLIVEIRSPSTGTIDRTTKRELSERAGVASYWLIDPAGPQLTILELIDGSYVQRTQAAGTSPMSVTSPFPVELSLSGVLR